MVVYVSRCNGPALAFQLGRYWLWRDALPLIVGVVGRNTYSPTMVPATVPVTAAARIGAAIGFPRLLVPASGTA